MNTFIIRFLDNTPIVVVAATIELAVMKTYNVIEDDLLNIMQGISYCILTPEQKKKLVGLS